MRDIKIFMDEEFGQIRTLLIDGEPWFVCDDIVAALGYPNTSSSVALMSIDDEDKTVADCSTTCDKQQDMVIINECGLYRLILSDRSSRTKKFKQWITGEVLHKLRVRPHSKATRLITTDDYLQAARIVATCKSTRLAIVLSLLESAGMEVPKVDGVKNNLSLLDIPESVIVFLEEFGEESVLGSKTTDIYDLYAAQCSRYGVEPVKKLSFSKYVNRALGTSVKMVHRGDDVYRIFERR